MQGKMCRMEENKRLSVSFVRIIMPAVVREGRLVLPRKFVNQYGAELSRTARLDVPVGASWHIGLKKSGHLLFLEDGWEKFMKYHSIRFGYFLLFEFKGNSRFNLHIFDLTATEIQYPLGSAFKRTNHANVKAARGKQFLDAADVEEEEVDESISDFLVATTNIRSSKQKASSEFPIQKRRRQEAILTRNEQKNPTRNQQQFSSSHGLNQRTTSSKNRWRSSKCQFVEKALHAAMMYKTDNPFFITKMKEYNVTDRYILNLPAHFAREITTDEAEFVEIQDSDNNKWPANCIIREGRGVVGISSGWRQFAKAKGLQIGDVCAFELIKTNGTIKVSLLS